MPLLCRAVVSLVFVKTVFGAYSCQTGYKSTTGDPKCAGATYSTCSTGSCCTKIKTCADYTAGWIIRQGLGTGCALTDKFFDTKKATTTVADTGLDADIITSCCTPFSAAKCSDWSLNTCSTGIRKESEASISAPAFPVASKSITSAKFTESCCEEKNFCPLGGLNFCVTGSLKFVDNKKNANRVRYDVSGDSASDLANKQAACCTLASQAVCSDWLDLYCLFGTCCDAGTSRTATGARSAPATAGSLLSTNAKYKENCCLAKAKCSTYSCPATHTPKAGTTDCSTSSSSSCTTSNCCTLKTTCGTNTILGATDCAAATKKFFDLKKLDATFVVSDVAATTTANRQAACCTPNADATCFDWKLKTCTSGTFDAGPSVTLAPDNADGITLSDAKYKTTCCVAATTCATAELADEVSSSFKSSTSSVAMMVALSSFFL